MAGKRKTKALNLGDRLEAMLQETIVDVLVEIEKYLKQRLTDKRRTDVVRLSGGVEYIPPRKRRSK